MKTVIKFILCLILGLSFSCQNTNNERLEDIPLSTGGSIQESKDISEFYEGDRMEPHGEDFLAERNKQDFEAGQNNKSNIKPKIIERNLKQEDELLKKRDRTSKHYKNKDKTITAILSPQSLHYLTDKGTWENINTNLVKTDRAGFSYQNITNNLKSWFPENPSRDGILISTDKVALKTTQNLTLNWKDSLGGAIISKAVESANLVVHENTLTYREILRNVDNQYIIHPDKVEHNFILNEKPLIPNGAEYLSISEEIELPLGWEVAFDENKMGLVILDEESKVHLEIPYPEIYESENRDVNPNLNEAGFEILPLENNNYQINTNVAVNWLKKRNYPVIIDPTIELAGVSAGSINYDYSYRRRSGWYGSSTTTRRYYVSNNDNAFIRVGWYSGGYSSSNSDTYRSWIKYNTSSIPDTEVISKVEFNPNVLSGSPESIPAYIHSSSVPGPYDTAQITSNAQWNYIVNSSRHAVSYFSNAGQQSYVILENGANERLQSLLSSNWFQIGFDSNGSSRYSPRPYRNFDRSQSFLRVTYGITCETIEGASSNPFPSNSAVDVCYDGGGAVTTIGWSPVVGATKYDVYFEANNGSPILIASDVEATTYNVGSLLGATTYYWKVIPKNDCDEEFTNVNTWSFTTANSSCSADYCEVNFSTVNPITKVVFATIENSSSASTSSPAFENFTPIETTVVEGSSQTLTVEANSGVDGALFITAFFDWNNNNDFTDDGVPVQLLPTISGSTGLDGVTASADITIPTGTNVSFGPTVMRVIASRYGYNTNPCLPVQDPNGTDPSSGQVEDYTLNICALPQANCKNFSVTLDYNGNASINAADIDDGSTANCGVQSIEISQTTFDCADLGTRIVELTITDTFGNSSSCQAQVEVIDNQLDYGNLQFPASAEVCEGTDIIAYGQVFEQGLTDSTNGQAPFIVAQFAYNSDNTDPATWPESSWSDASFNVESGNNDEYQYTFGSTLSPGTYYYTFRYTITGCEWLYGGFDTLGTEFDEDDWDGSEDVNGELTILENHSLTYVSGSTNQVVCANTAIEEIVYTIGGGASSATITPVLPAGLNFNPATATISGSPSQPGTYNYTITTVGNSCPVATANGSIISTSLDFVNLQFPSSANICPGDDVTIFGQVFEPGLTEAAGQGAGIEVEFNYNDENTDPSTWANWTIAEFNTQVGNNDEYKGTFGASLAVGTYYYAFRYRLSGCDWQYGGLGGTWNNDSGFLVIESLDFVNLQFPASETICEGGEITAFGQVYELGLTEAGGPGNGIEAQLGYGTNLDPNSWATWMSANYNGQGGTNNNNDEYSATFGSGLSPGTYNYTFRYRLNGCAWQYGFLNNSANYGLLTVNSAPEITTTYPNIIVNSEGGQCGSTINYAAADVTGTPAPTITYSQDSGTFFPVGISTVTVNASNDCGDDIKVFTVTVLDNENPTIACAPAVSINNTPSECYGEVVLTPPTATDNCSVPGNALNFDGANDHIVVSNPNDFNLTATDDFTIQGLIKTTRDKATIFSKMVVGSPFGYQFWVWDGKLALEWGDGGISFIFSNAIVNDGQYHHVAAVVSRSSSNLKLYVDGVLEANVTNARYTSEMNNSASVFIGQERSLNPNLRWQGDIDELAFFKSARTSSQILGSTTSQLTGNEPNLVSYWKFNSGIAGGNNAGITTAIDDNANSHDGSLMNFALNGLSSNWVGGQTFGPTVTNNAPATYPIGDITVTWTATDAAGNTATCEQIVTVIDNEIPVITHNGDKNVNTDLDTCGASVSVSASTEDNCNVGDAIGVRSDGLALDVLYPVGVTTITWNVSDDSDNPAAEVTQTVMVTDNQNPNAIAQNFTVQLDASGNVSITPADVNNGSNDACGIASLALDITSFDCSNVGANTVTLTVTDNNGNVSTETATVTVEDNVSPITLTKPATVQLDALGNGSITPTDVDNGSSDACGVTLSVSPNFFGCSNVGANTVTLTSTDVNGNSSSATATVTVEDNVDPITLTQNVTVQLDANGNGSITTADIDNGSNDACGIASLALDITSFDCSNVGANTVTLTSTDVNGNSSSAAATVTVEDNVDPITLTQNVTVQLDANGNGSITTADIDNGSNDACGIASLTLDITSFDCSNVGANTVTLTSTDVNGNSSSATATVTVEDNVDPITLTQNVTVQLDANGNGSITTADIDNGSNDACGIASLTLDITSFDCSNVGANTVTLTSTDVNGNSSSATATVTVEDNVDPITLTQNVTVQLDANGNGSITTADIDNGSNDACGIASLTLDITSFDCSNAGANTVTLTSTDVNGNSSSATATVTVEDNVDPITLTQNVTVQLDANGNGSITTADIDNGSNDACGIASLALDITSFDCSNVGANTVTLTSTDVNGNSSSATATVTVEDNVDPITLTQNVTVQLDANGNGSITTADIDNGSNDACGIASLALDITSFDCSNVGANTVTLTSTDVNGNSSSATATVTVVDEIAPIINCAEIEVILEANGTNTLNQNQIDLIEASVSDNCEIESIELAQTNFSCADIGGDLDELIISEYIDGSTYIGEYQDDMGATVTGEIANKYIEIFNGTGVTVDLAALNYELVVYSDNVLPSQTPIIIPLLGEIKDRETFVISFPSGEESFLESDQTGLLMFTGNDAIALTKGGSAIDIIGIIGDNLAEGSGWTSGGNSTLGTTLIRNIDVLQGNVLGDNSGLGSEWTSYPIDSFGDLGSHTIDIEGNNNNVLLTVTDTSGNTSTCEVQVQVIDNTNPEVITKDIDVFLDANGEVSITPAQINNGSSDSCGISGLALDIEDFTCADIGANTVVLIVTDVNGNSATDTATVTVIDNLPPIVNTQDITVQLDANGIASITPADVDDDSTDNCAIASYALDIDSFDCSDIQGALNTNNTVVVTLTVTDVNGNSASGPATVTLEDNVIPEAICADITVTLDSNGEVVVTGEDVGFGSTDPCGIATYEIKRAADGDESFADSIIFYCEDEGANAVTIRVTDVNGNMDTCTANVTVDGDFPEVDISSSDLPEFCQGAVIVLTANSDLDVAYQWFFEGDEIANATDASIEVDEDGEYTVIVTSATNCTAENNFTVSGFDKGGLLSAYTILATEEVFLIGSNLVESGGVGAMLPGSGNVKLHQASTVADFTQAATISLQQGSDGGEEILSPANPTLPDFQFNSVSNAGSPNAIVTGTQTLDGSVYNIVEVGEGAEVTFTAPNVFINELKTWKESAIEFTGCTNVLINERFQLAQNSTINLSTDSKVTFYVNDDVSIEKGSFVRASIYAFNHNITAKGLNGGKNKDPEPTFMTGLFIANRVQGNKNVVWNADDLCDSCPVTDSPSARTSEPKDVLLSEFDAKGWPSPSDTQFNIKVRTENKADIVTIEVFDMGNKLVHSKQFNHNDTYRFGEKLDGGVYIVKISQGGSLKILRLIKN